MKRLAFAALVWTLLPSPAAAGTLELTMRDGLVTLVAEEVTVRQILAEWARVGQTRIVNAERVGGGPVTLRLERQPERQALDTILRLVPGYVAVPRETFVAHASMYDSILIMPTTSAVAAVRPPPPTPAAGPTFGGFPGTQGMPTQLRLTPPQPPLTPGMVPVPAEPEPAEESDDPAIAAAAAAGLVPVPALAPAPMPGAMPLTLPGPTPPAAAEPSNPWNAPVGTPQPSLAPPPPSPSPAPAMRGRPPAADR